MNEKGLSLLEILVSMAILFIGIMAVIRIFPEGFMAIERTNAMAVSQSLLAYQVSELKRMGYDQLPDTLVVPDVERTVTIDAASPLMLMPCVKIGSRLLGTVEARSGSDGDFETISPVSVGSEPYYEIEPAPDLSNPLPLNGNPFTLRLHGVDLSAPGSLVRMGYVVRDWGYAGNPPGAKIAFSSSTRNGLEDGYGLVFVTYGNETTANLREDDTESNPPIKMVTAKIYWNERGKMRSMSRQIVLAKER